MVSFNSVQKVIFLGVLVATVPIMALNMLMPRLAIADQSKMTLGLLDLTVENFTSGDVNGHGPKNTTTLDMWLQVGLPVKNDSLTSNDSLTKAVRKTLNNTWDTSYYLNGDFNQPNVANLVDPTENIFVPQLNLTASYNGQLVGTGGTVKVYQLNKTHPVEYVHIYINCSREPNDGFMYMFKQITASGGLDNLILGLLGGGGSTGNLAGALLGGLSLQLTAFAGSAPLTLNIGASFFTSEIPGIPASSVASSSLAPAATGASSIMHYNPRMNIHEFGSMDRFTDQLGFNGPNAADKLTGILGSSYSGNLEALLPPIGQMLFTSFDLFGAYTNYTMKSTDNWWIQPGKTIYTGVAYNNANASDPDYLPTTSMEDKLTSALTWFQATYDPDSAFNASNPLPTKPFDKATLDSTMNTTIHNAIIMNPAHGKAMNDSWATYTDGSNKSSWYWRLFENSTQVTVKVPCQFASLISVPNYVSNFTNKAFGTNITFTGNPPTTSGMALLSLFELFHNNGYNLGDMFNAVGLTVPDVLTGLLFSDPTITANITAQDPVTNKYVSYSYGPETGSYNSRNGGIVVIGPTSYNPAFGSIQSQSLLLVIVILAFIVVLGLATITKGTVSINRREFLGREDVQRNINAFIKQVEQLGGKVSVQNAEALVIRAFRSQGKIEKAPDVEKRSKTYVENQKLLVTLQSRASRAYVAQKFKDCIAAIEKMIDIARKLEDQTLVANYEDNLAKVVKLLRRKGISVSTKMRVEEGAAAGSEVEKLGAYKKDLIDLQNKASKLFAERNWAEAKNCIKDMLAIAKKIQDPVLIRNYEANLRKIISMEKGGTA